MLATTYPSRAPGSWRGVRLMLVLAAVTALGAPPAGAVFRGNTPPNAAPAAAPADPDYAQGLTAFQAKDWRQVVQSMSRLLARQQNHDDGWARLGFAYRKLGRYKDSLWSYDKALALNPNHRGALEYLGEAYLELNRVADAEQTLKRLATVCGATGCEELTELKAKIEAYTATGNVTASW